MKHRLIIVLKGAAVIAAIIFGGITGCFVLGILISPTENSILNGLLLGFAFSGGTLIAGTILYVIFGFGEL